MYINSLTFPEYIHCDSLHYYFAAGAGWVGYFLYFSSRLFYLPFLMPHLLDILKYIKYRAACRPGGPNIEL